MFLKNGNGKAPDWTAFDVVLFILTSTQNNDLVPIISVFLTESGDVWTNE
jgi:hypothetical protein